MITKLNIWQKRGREGGKCEMCGWQVSKLTVDHIVPVHFIVSFDETNEGKDQDEENFQLICYPCQHKKGSSFDRTNPKTKEIILKYLK